MPSHLLFVLPLILAQPVGGEKAPLAEAEPVVVQERERESFLRLPLAVPALAVRALGAPFRGFANFSERVDLKERAIDFFSNDERTFYFYPTLRIGGEGGFYAGMGASHRDLFGEGVSLGAEASVSPGLDQNASFSVGSPDFSPWRMSSGVGANWRVRQTEDYFGQGNDSDEEGIPYKSRLLTFGAPIHGKIRKWGEWKLFANGVFQTTEDSGDPADSLAGSFPPNQIVGAGETIGGGEFGGSFKVETVDRKGTPGKGVKGGIQFSRFEGEAPYGFFRSSAWGAGFFTLGRPMRVLAIGGRVEAVQTLSGESVPFAMLPYVGGPSYLRAYPSRRFRDRTSLAAVMEYRYPVWQMVDGLFFIEGGRVADSVDELSPAGFHPSGGFGLRFRTAYLSFFQLQGAYGSEGARFVFTLNEAL